MPRPDFNTPRLFTPHDLAPGRAAALDSAQAHYLIKVLRLEEGARVLAFNGRDGEFAGTLKPEGKRGALLLLEERVREQAQPVDLDYLFAPLKHARLDYLAQKAVEMGVCALRPVLTRRTQTSRINLERLHANAVEAAEQCGVLWVPRVEEERRLVDVLDDWPAGRLLVFCDEDAPVASAIEALRGRALDGGASLLIGPEGGFDEDERRRLLAVPGVVRLNLGPRILRADTAAVAALALLQVTLGDWRG